MAITENDISSYYRKMQSYASKASNLLNIPTEIILAQWALESNYGKSLFATEYNNHGGITYTSNADGQIPDTGFASYYNISNFVEDYIRVLSLDRYTNIREATTKKEALAKLCSSSYCAEGYNYSVLSNMTKKAYNVITGEVLNFEEVYGDDNETVINYTSTEEVILQDLRYNKKSYDYLYELDYKNTLGSFNTAKVYTWMLSKNIVEFIDALQLRYYNYPSSLVGIKLICKFVSGNLYNIDIDDSYIEQAKDVRNTRQLTNNVVEENSYEIVTNVIPNLQNKSYIVGSITSETNDAHYINIYVNELHNCVLQGNPNTINVRLAGIYTCGTKRDDDSVMNQSRDRNISWLKKKGLYNESNEENLLDQTYALGNEASSLVNELTSNKLITVVIDNPPIDGTKFSYDSIAGIVLVDNGEWGANVINVNQTLLASTSKAMPEQRLAELTMDYESVNNISKWWTYTKDKDEVENYVLEKEKNYKTSLQSFLDANNLRIGEDNIIDFGGSTHKQVNVVRHLIRYDETLKDIVSLYTKGKQYTNEDKIASYNQYSIKELTQALKNNKLVGEEISIPIFEKGYDTTQDYFAMMHEANINNIPADSEYEDYIKLTHDDRDRLDGIDRESMTVEEIDELYKNGFTRIGDVTLMIPPVSISVDTIYGSRTVDTLRNKSGITLQQGHGLKTFTLDLMFNGQEQINGYEVLDPSLNPLIGSPLSVRQRWFRNGLRQLIAEFKKTPFVPIENNLINDAYGVYSIALSNLVIKSVPGFPFLVNAIITVLAFDHKAYMPAEEDFAGTINWRMFRWYYQDAMIENIKKKNSITLSPMTRIDNKIRFKIMDETQLAQRATATTELNDKLSPSAYSNELQRDENFLKEKEDYKSFNDAITRKNEIQKWCQTYSPLEYPYIYKSGRTLDFSQLENKFSDVFDEDKTPSITDEMRKYKACILNLLEDIYFNTQIPTTTDLVSTDKTGSRKSTISGKSVELAFLPNYLNKALTFINRLNRLEYPNKKQSVAIFTISKSKIQYAYSNFTRYSEMVINSPVTFLSRAHGVLVVKANSSNGMQMYDDSENQAFIKINASVPIKDGITNNKYLLIDPYGRDLMIKEVLNSYNSISQEEIRYEMEFNNLFNTANLNEDDIRTVDFPIEGDYWVESYSSKMLNNFVPLTIADDEEPTLQYMGNSQSTFNITIICTSLDTIKSIRCLFEESQRLARNYNIDLVSSVITIDSDIFHLQGIKDTIISQINVETVPGLVDVFRITLEFKVFDKNQGNREALEEEGISQFINGEGNYYQYNQKRRSDPNYEYGSVDFKLRNAEMYPDLEMPEYDRLNEVLPYLKIKRVNGESFNYFPNPMGGRYLDPDFYIRSVKTVRNIVDEQLNMTNAAYMYDDLGHDAIELAPETSQNFMTSPNLYLGDKTVEFIKGNIGNYNQTQTDFGDATYINSKFQSLRLDSVQETKYKEFLYKAKNYKTLSTSNAKIGKTNWDITEVKDYLNSPEYMTIYAQKNTFSKADVCNYIIDTVKVFFANHLVDEASGEIVANDSYTYGPTRLSCPIITTTKIVNIIKSIFEAQSNWEQYLADSKDKAYVIIDDFGNLGISGININCGLFNSKTDLLRAALDWKVNIHYAINYFAMTYNGCINYKYDTDQNTIDDINGNPLDWAIVGYYQGGYGKYDDVFKVRHVNGDVYYNKILNIFASSYGLGAQYQMSTTDQLFDKTLCNTISASNMGSELQSICNEISQTAPGVIDTSNSSLKNYIGVNMYIASFGTTAFGQFSGTKKISDHPSTGYFNVVLYDANKYPTSENNEDTTVSKDDKEKFINIVYQRICQDYYEANYNHKHVESGKPFVIVIKEGSYDLVQEAIDGKVDLFAAFRSNGNENYDDIKDINSSSLYEIKYIDKVEEATNVVTEIVASNPELLFTGEDQGIGDRYRSSCDDLLNYDQRGRLIRAFPAYQIFIIDEGRWMLWHKLWDNFYGYNSVISMDIVKDRRIAADTATIQFSNIYNNLNQIDEGVSYDNWDVAFEDLIFGSSDDRKRFIKNIIGLPDDEIIRARTEKINSLLLAPGARLHIRLGYGANAYALPVMFNGTITELELGEIVTVIAQSDAIELTNKMNVNVDDTTDPGRLSITLEPRKMLCETLLSKGSWFKNKMNILTNGAFFNQNALGIVHFGNELVPEHMGKIFKNPFNEANSDYGEAGINIYCSAGKETFSQWVFTEGIKQDSSIGWNWTGNFGFPKPAGDEPNIQIYLFDKTFWDLAQVYVACSPDYIAAVHPFEYRSTFFYGKPHWGLLDKYIYQYSWDEYSQSVSRKAVGGIRKAYSQFKIYHSSCDILSNNITVNSKGVYTNVVGVYNERDGAKNLSPVQLDSDIYAQFQRTAIVHIPIQADKNLTNTFTQEKYATAAATTALRDYVKDMYTGELIVIGDSTAKPYDTMYINDIHSQMTGIAEIKRTIHHLGTDCGYITSISPDMVSIIDDSEGISMKTWLASLGAGVAATIGAYKLTGSIFKNLATCELISVIRKYGSKGVEKIIEKTIVKDYRKALIKNFLGSDAFDQLSRKQLTTLLNCPRFSDTLKAYCSITNTNAKYLTPELSKLAQQMGTSIDDLLDMIEKVGVSDISKQAANLKTSVPDIIKQLYPDAYKFLSDANKNVFSHITNGAKKVWLGGVTNSIRDINKIIDDVWDASSLLSKKSLFQSKGLLRKTGNGLWKLVNFSAKTGTKVAADVGASAAKAITAAVKSPALRANILAIAVDIGFTILTAGLIERYQRYLRSRQALVLMPLTYLGKPLIGGIDGHAGCIYGDNPSKFDRFFEGTGFLGEAVSVFNMLFDIDIDY